MPAMASVSSLDKDLAKLRLSKYTQSSANEVLDWIVDVLNLSPPSTRDLIEFLKDGTVLCSLVSPLLNTPLRPRKSAMPFIQMENIALFLTAISQPPVSLPPPDLFLTVDLYENKDPAQVVQTLNSFSRVAHRLKPSVYHSAIGGRTGSAALSPQSTAGQPTPYTPNRFFPRSQSSFAPPSPNKPSSLVSPKVPLNRAETDTRALGGGVVPKPPTPMWNVIQYGGPGGYSQGELGISFGGTRQITSPGPTVPSLREKEERRKKEEEARRLREEDEAARREEEERRREEDARLKAEEEAWVRQQEQAMRMQEEEARAIAEEKRLWELEESARRKREELYQEEQRIAALRQRAEEERRREDAHRKQQEEDARRRQEQEDDERRRQEQEHYEAERLRHEQEDRAARERERIERDRAEREEQRRKAYEAHHREDEDINASRERERQRIKELERELQRARERERQYEIEKENQRRAEVQQRRREAEELVQRPLRTGDRLRNQRTGERASEMVPSRTGDREPLRTQRTGDRMVPSRTGDRDPLRTQRTGELRNQRTGELRNQRTGELRNQRTGDRNHYIRSHATGSQDTLIKHRTGDRPDREIIRLASSDAPVQVPHYSGQSPDPSIVRSHRTGGSLRSRQREEREVEREFLQDAYTRYRSNGNGDTYTPVPASDAGEPIPQRALPTPPRKPQNLAQPALPPRQASPSRPLPDPAAYGGKPSWQQRQGQEPQPTVTQTQLSPSRVSPIKPRWGGSSFLEREREKERQRQKEWEREQLEREGGEYGVRGPRGPR